MREASKDLIQSALIELFRRNTGLALALSFFLFPTETELLLEPSGGKKKLEKNLK